MSFSLLADVEVRKITELEPQWFSARDIRLVLLDFDNTIVPYTTWCPTAERAAGCRIFAKNGTFHGSAMRESPTQRALERPWSA